MRQINKSTMKQIILNNDYEVKYNIKYIPTGDWTDTYNLSISRYSDEFNGSQHSVMKILSEQETKRIFNEINEYNVEEIYRTFKNKTT